MPGLWHRWKKRRFLRQRYVPVLEEMEQNMEAYYVGEQVGRFKAFTCEQLKKTEPYDSQWPEEVVVYRDRIETYQASFNECEVFERRYQTEPGMKTRPNAAILHEKKEKVRDLFRGMEAVIRSSLVRVQEDLVKKDILNPDEFVRYKKPWRRPS